MVSTPSAPEALLVLSFGGPEGPDDVMPFLENVTRGRGVPRERLEAVAEHYHHFGGVSPINAHNRDLVARLQEALDLPVYFGNRNWHPMLEDTVAQMTADGVARALVFATSAWGGYSGCRQYHEDIARARGSVDGAPELTKLRQFFDHPLFVAAVADAVRRVWDGAARLVFTAHSVPVAADTNAGTGAEGGHRYSRQVAEAARLVAAELGADEFDVVWQSRSGPPQVPWLEPDVVDHLDALHAKGIRSVVLVPVGFVSDHLEVVWDLDVEAAQHAAELGMTCVRAGTVIGDERFVAMIGELVAEHADGIAPRRLSTIPADGAGTNGLPCLPGCCEPVRRPQ